jgi:type II secretory ATPase GspE/PulE/Tfp pilus assembly ATPase PilB-like protein
VVTIEDPVEYQIEMINQVQVQEIAGLTFASTLRTVLRQDPDIVMVGEIRDGETANTAVQAALTGHLVLSTLHTNDAVGAVTRLVNMGVEPYLISSSLVGVVAQRLLRKLCHSCRAKVTLNPALRKTLKLPVKSEATLYRAVGCEECFHRGYRGRTGVFEVFKVDDTLREMISASASEEKMRKHLAAAGMSTLYAEGLHQAREGVTSLEEAMRIAVAGE